MSYMLLELSLDILMYSNGYKSSLKTVEKLRSVVILYYSRKNTIYHSMQYTKMS